MLCKVALTALSNKAGAVAAVAKAKDAAAAALNTTRLSNLATGGTLAGDRPAVAARSRHVEEAAQDVVEEEALQERATQSTAISAAHGVFITPQTAGKESARSAQTP